MKTTIEIRALNDEEIVAALKMPKFDILNPVSCMIRGHSGSFARRVFIAAGVPKNKFNDDFIQDSISEAMAAQFGISHVFFKSPGSGDTLYLDSAICPECQSTKVVFDIKLPKNFHSKFSRD